MSIEYAKLLGAFIRWLFKGCKTSWKDETEGNLDPTWGSSYDMENYIIGVITAIVVIGLVMIIFFR